MLISMTFKRRQILQHALDRLEQLTKSAQSALKNAELSTLAADEQMAVLEAARDKIPETKNDWDITLRITSAYRDSLFALGAECRKIEKKQQLSLGIEEPDDTRRQADTIQAMLRELGDQRDIFAESNVKPPGAE